MFIYLVIYFQFLLRLWRVILAQINNNYNDQNLIFCITESILVQFSKCIILLSRFSSFFGYMNLGITNNLVCSVSHICSVKKVIQVYFVSNSYNLLFNKLKCINYCPILPLKLMHVIDTSHEYVNFRF